MDVRTGYVEHRIVLTDSPLSHNRYGGLSSGVVAA